MSDRSRIEWTDASWNPVRGCALVSKGCTNCYAMRQAHRFSRVGGTFAELTKQTSHGPVWTGEVRTYPELLDLPLRWTKPRRVFVNSMSDLFHEEVPFAFVDRVFAVMALTPRHTFQILTKRPERMREYMAAKLGSRVPSRWGRVMGIAWEILGHMPKFEHEGIDTRPWPLPNVWLGTSVEDQATADERVPLLLQTPAAMRFLSCEPLLGPVDLCEPLGMWWNSTMQCFESTGRELNRRGREGYAKPGIGWVIVGGESGPGARPFDVGWARAIVAQCRAARVPVFVKQLGSQPRGWCASNVPENIGLEEHREILADDPRCCDFFEAHEQGQTCESLGRRCAMMFDRKGGDPAEWPEDLRVREWPSREQREGSGGAP